MKQFLATSAKNTAIMVIMIFLSGLIFIRLAPDDIASVHVPPPVGAATPDTPIISRDGALFVLDFKADADTVLAWVEQVANDTPRTKKIAGDKKDRLLTFVSRSLVFGFSDYTTVRAVSSATGTRLVIMGRLRFGKSDFGVNEARIRDWLKVLEAFDQAR